MDRRLAACAAMIGFLAAPALAAPDHGAAGEATAPPLATHVDWLAKPSADDMTEAYPARAAEEQVTGHVILHCNVSTTGRTEACQVLEETPKGYGFGDAALRIAPLFRMAPATAGGSATVSEVTIPVRFALPAPQPAGSKSDSNAFDPDGLAALQVIGGVMLALAATPLVAALSDRLRRRRARTAGIGEALERGFSLVGATFRRAPLPLVIYASLIAIAQAVGPAASLQSGATPDLAAAGRMLALLPLVLAGGTLAYGAAFRAAFERRGDPAFKIRRLGLQVGRVEGRLVLAILVLLFLLLVGGAGLGLMGVLAWFAARAAAGANAPVALLALAPCLLLILALLLAYRLNTFVAAWVAEGGERLAASWRATRACLAPPILISMVLTLLTFILSLGLALPIRLMLSSPNLGVMRLGAGVAYGVLAALFVPVRVGVAAYFYERLQAPQAAPLTTEA